MCIEGECLGGTQALPNPKLNSWTVTRALQYGEDYHVCGSSELSEDHRVRGAEQLQTSLLPLTLSHTAST